MSLFHVFLQLSYYVKRDGGDYIVEGVHTDNLTVQYNTTLAMAYKE